MIQNVKKHLTNNGIFLFTTPNLEGNGAKILNKSGQVTEMIMLL